jgi:hypothetical protein
LMIRLPLRAGLTLSLLSRCPCTRLYFLYQTLLACQGCLSLELFLD